jgi:ubiquinone/menaquinone biosynthesis C-methylase UbiE
MNRAKADYFDSQVHAHWAGSDYSQEENAKIQRMLSLVGWHPHMRILEPGCGTGRLTEYLADLAEPPGFILAFDISSGMVEAARKRLRDSRLARVECIDLESLDLRPQSFDLVICHQVLPHFDDKDQALARMAGCLKPGGKIAVLHFIGSAVINDTHRKTSPAVQADTMPDEQSMTRLFTGAGFSVMHMEDSDDGYLLVGELRKA